MVLMEALNHQKKKINISFTKANKKLCLSLHIMLIIVIFLLIEKKSLFRTDNKNVKFPTQFCLGSVSDGFSNVESNPLMHNFPKWSGTL